MDERAPCGGGEDVQAASGQGVGDERDDDQVEPHPGREPVDGGEPQHRRGHAVGLQAEQRGLGVGFGARVQRQRMQRGGLVGRLAAVPVDAAGGGEHEPRHSGIRGGFMQRDGGVEVDRAGQSGFGGARRVADDTR